MPSALPRVEVELRQQLVPGNPNDTATIMGVVGTAARGPINTPRTLLRIGDLSEFGNGVAPEAAAAILARAGGPVRIARAATSIDGVLAAVAKYPAAVVPGLLFGGLLLPGADANGEVFVTAKVAGLSVAVVNPAADHTLSHTYVGGAITITLGYAAGAIDTDAGELATYINASLTAYLVATPQGTGASLVSALARADIADGDISYQARQDGVRVRHVATGNNTALSVGVAGKDITVNLATDANGTPTSTAAQVVAKVLDSSAAALLVGPTASGTGTGFAGIWGYVALTFGSSAAVVLSGLPVDKFSDIRIECVRGGTVGGTPTPTVRWSLDGGANWTNPQALPANGILPMANGKIDTGITATFTGTLVTFDLWMSSSIEPQATVPDLLDAATALLNDPSKPLGCVLVMQPVTRAQAAQFDALAQAKWPTAHAAVLLNVRDQTVGETRAAWADSVTNNYLGYESNIGVMRVGAGFAPHASFYSGFTYHRPAAMFFAGARAATPVHMSAAQTKAFAATSGGTTFIMGGQIRDLGRPEPGNAVIGGVFYQGKDSGVAVQHAQQTGNNKPLRVAVDAVITVSGARTVVTVSLGTDNAGAINSTTQNVMDAVNAVASRYLTAALPGASVTASATAYAIEIPELPVTHDEYLAEGLDAQRFITMRSFSENPGAYYFTLDRTFAPIDAVGYDLVCLADVVYSVARIASNKAFTWLVRVLPAIAVAESESVPAGAMDKAAALEIGADISGDIEQFLFRPKLDGAVSASRYPAGADAAEVLRDYSYKTSREIRVSVTVYLLGVSKVIRLIVQPR